MSNWKTVPRESVVVYEDTRRYREGRHDNCPSCTQYKPVNCHECGIFLDRDGKCARGCQYKQNCKLCGRFLRKDGTCTQMHDPIGEARKHRLYDNLIDERRYGGSNPSYSDRPSVGIWS